MKGRVLIQGITGNTGTAIGYVRIVDADNITKVEKGDVLVFNKLEHWPNSLVSKDIEENAVALIQNVGGRTSRGGIACKAFEKPGLVGTVYVSGEKATDVLKEGMMVVVEGYSGETDTVSARGKPDKVKYGTVYQYLPDEPGVPEVIAPEPHIISSNKLGVDAIAEAVRKIKEKI